VSTIGNQIWWLLPGWRKRKTKAESTLWGLVDAVGEILDTLKTAILISRLRRFFLVRSQTDTQDYYSSAERSSDLEAHGRDRGLMRLPEETDPQLLERLSTLPYRNGFLGSKTGMKYLIEEIFGLLLDSLVEFYADDMALIVLSENEQAAETEINLSHVFNLQDQETWDAYRQNRIFQSDDVTQAFHFALNISNPAFVDYDPEVVTQLVNAQKPAHTRVIIYFG